MIIRIASKLNSNTPVYRRMTARCCQGYPSICFHLVALHFWAWGSFGLHNQRSSCPDIHQSQVPPAQASSKNRTSLQTSKCHLTILSDVSANAPFSPSSSMTISCITEQYRTFSFLSCPSLFTVQVVKRFTNLPQLTLCIERCRSDKVGENL